MKGRERIRRVSVSVLYREVREDPHVVKGEHPGDRLGRISAVVRQALPDFAARDREPQPRGTGHLAHAHDAVQKLDGAELLDLLWRNAHRVKRLSQGPLD